MSERADQPATPEIPNGVPGKALAAQREAMGWTVEQVADQLKLAPRQVVALEAGDYASLPSPAVVRGFVRAYAKILRLDAAPLVAMIPMDTPDTAANTATVRREKPATFSESSRFPLHGKRSSLPIGWIVAAVAVIGAAAAAWHLGVFRTTGGEAAPGSPASSTVLPAPASVPAGSASEPVQKPEVPLISVPGQNPPAPGGEAQPGAAPAAPAATPGATGGPAAAAQPAPAAAQPAALQQPVQAATATAVGPNSLVLTVREDSWIQVRTADGKNLISRLVKAGSTENVTVEQPVTVTVGNPKGVSASLRGSAVELPMLPGKTIARVSLK